MEKRLFSLVAPNMKANIFLENKNESCSLCGPVAYNAFSEGLQWQPACTTLPGGATATFSYSAQLTAVADSPLCLASEGPHQLFLLFCTSDIRYKNPFSALPMSPSNVLPTLLC